MFKSLAEYKKGPNSFSSNCILQTAFDNNFMSEELLVPSEYENKICVKKASENDHVGHFIHVPQVNVTENARKLGFTHRVDYPNSNGNIAKFYKILTASDLKIGLRTATNVWHWHRMCAAHGGLLASPYTPAQGDKN